MASLLQQLKSMTAIVADTGDIEAIRHHQPQDATTNPSLLLKAATLPEYVPLITDSIAWARSQSNEREGINCNLTLMFGLAQARAWAGVTLLFPFVSRILGWHKARAGHVSCRKKILGLSPCARFILLQGARLQDHRHGRIIPQ